MTKWKATFLNVIEVEAETRDEAKDKAWLAWQEEAINFTSKITLEKVKE